MGSDKEETEDLLPRSQESTGYSLVDSEDDLRDGEEKRLTADDVIETGGFGKFHFILVIVMGWANSADTIEMLSVSFVLPQASCEFKATDFQLGILSAVGFAGMIIGSYFWGSLADVKGRLKATIVCQAINSIFIIGSSLSQSLWFLILMRFFSGFGVGGTSPLIFVYTVELLPQKSRGRMTALLTCTFMVGQILVAGLAWLIIPHTEWVSSVKGFTFNSWRIFLLTSSIPAFTSCLLFMWFPESPRYLIKMNRMSEAKDVMRRIYRINGYTQPYDDDYKIVRQKTKNTQGICLVIKKMFVNSWDLVRRPDIRPRFLYSSTILFCLAFGYYGLTMWFPTLLDRMEAANATSVCGGSTLPAVNRSICDTSNQQQVYFETFLQAGSSLPGNILYLLLVDVIGRKLFTGVSMILTALSVFCIWFVSNHLGSIILTCVFAGFSVVTWNAMALLGTEIFPTEIRSTARGVQSAFANRLASVLANVVFGALVTTHCEVPIVLIACLLTFGGILTYKLPNTTRAPIN